MHGVSHPRFRLRFDEPMKIYGVPVDSGLGIALVLATFCFGQVLGTVFMKWMGYTK